MIELLASIDITALLFGSFIILLILGVPIAHALGAATLLVLYAQGIPGVFLPQTAFNTTDSFPLVAVPFFVLAGYLMEFGGLSLRLVNLASAVIGHVTGGFACVTILACMFFAAMSGSGPATVAAIGTLMIPAMVRARYEPAFAGAVASTGGTLGIMIPPSNPMIIYGVVGNVSVTQLFIAGIVPGTLTGLILIAASWWLCRRLGFVGGTERPSGRRLLRAILDARWALMAPVIVLGGIYGGVFTPTEASVVAAVYGLLVGGSVTIIVGLASGFGRLLTQYQIPQQLATYTLSWSTDPFVVLMIINVGLIIIGTFMETLATIILLTPILLPLVIELGVDPIHFGILLVITSEIGFLTPPLGVNLFVAMGIANVTLEQISKAVWPYIVVLTLVTVLLTAVPEISLWLPRLLR
jgi:C4-dicarboxylate transporter DctM subunit